MILTPSFWLEFPERLETMPCGNDDMLFANGYKAGLLTDNAQRYIIWEWSSIGRPVYL